jgi:uncharacterized membrane protein
MEGLTPADYQGFLSALGFALICLGLVLSMLPVGECDKCAHCREQRMKGTTPRCVMCLKRHDPKERCDR